MSILDKLKKNSTIKMTELLTESMVYENVESTPTEVPAMNIALSASLDGGLTPGLTILAGPSKHFKTNMALVMGRAFQKKYKDGVILFYDSEFGSPQAYFEANGIDPARVIHTPITDIEQLKFDLMQQLDGLERKDEVIIIIDSIGNLASKKEVDDALDGKSVGDMTRAKQLKSLFRMVTPHLTLKQIPLVAVNHTYACGEGHIEVIMGDGSSRRLDAIKVGDEVLTVAGVETVQWTTQHEDAFVTELQLEDDTSLAFTGGHKLRVDGHWKLVEDMRVGDRLDMYGDPGTRLSRRIKAVNFACRKSMVYDFETPSHSYILKNGIVSHNTQEMYSKQVVSGGCLVAGERIRMADGSTKAVETIQVGDEVLTMVGPKPVTAIWNPTTLEFGAPPCLEIAFQGVSGQSAVRCSNHHPFMIDSLWVDAEDINLGDRIQRSDEYTTDLIVERISSIGNQEVYDISVADAEHYILDNGAVTHNTGLYYSANQIFIIGRQQNKDGDELVGYNFIINIEKSRYVREKTKVPLAVTFEGGISRWSGLVDIALESGHVIKPKAGWYQKVDVETGEVLPKSYRLKDTDCSEFWNPILKSKSFNDYIEKTYKVAFGSMSSTEEEIEAVND